MSASVVSLDKPKAEFFSFKSSYLQNIFHKIDIFAYDYFKLIAFIAPIFICMITSKTTLLAGTVLYFSYRYLTSCQLTSNKPVLTKQDLSFIQIAAVLSVIHKVYGGPFQSLAFVFSAKAGGDTCYRFFQHVDFC